MRNQFFGLWWGYRLANLAAQPFPPVVTLVPMMLAAMLVLSACGGGGGGGLAAGPVVYVEGTDRLANPQQGSSESATDGDIYYRGAAGGDAGELGVPTPGTVPNPAHYETAEYFASGSPAPLATGKFSTAYARGWTGHGSLVAIADTGVDADHPDLAANIAASRDFTGTVNDDRHGHGTHVAGIVAAVKNGAGVHGGHLMPCWRLARQLIQGPMIFRPLGRQLHGPAIWDLWRSMSAPPICVIAIWNAVSFRLDRVTIISITPPMGRAASMM